MNKVIERIITKLTEMKWIFDEQKRKIFFSDNQLVLRMLIKLHSLYALHMYNVLWSQSFKLTK